MVDEQLESALAFLDPSTLSYDEWLHVMMGWKYEGGSYEDIDAWNRRDPNRYNERGNLRTWESISNDKDNPTRGRTIFKMAQERGWTRPACGAETVYGWDDIGYAAEDTTPEPRNHGTEATPRRQEPMEIYGLPKFGTLPEPCPMEPLEIDPADQLRMQLRAMFGVGDYVNVVTDKGRMGGETQNVDAWYQEAEGILSSVTAEGGAYLCVNPLHEGRRTNDNVAAYRNALVECDELPTKQQLDLMRRLRLPVRCFVDSGNKSIHAVVAVDASNAEEYRERVRALYGYCEANGLPVDEACKNPSRLMRLAGAKRGEKVQNLIAAGVGPRCWDEFMFCVQGLAERQSAETDTPDNCEMNLADFIDAPEEPKDWCIQGLAEFGEVMSIGGMSGCGKTTLMYEGGVALASGKEWMGYRPERLCNVLLYDPELPGRTAKRRAQKVCKKMGVTIEDAERRLTILCGREHPLTVEGLKEYILKKRAAGITFDAVLIDSFSVVTSADDKANENDNADVNRRFITVKQIAALGCFVVLTQHAPKYAASSFKSGGGMARGAEAYRAAPDIVASLVPLEIAEGSGAWELQKTYAFRAHSDVPGECKTVYPAGVRLTYDKTRDTPTLPDVNMLYRYPLHIVDNTGELEECKIAFYAKPKAESNANDNATDAESEEEALTRIVAELSDAGGVADSSHVTKALNEWRKGCGRKRFVSVETVERYCKPGSKRRYFSVETVGAGMMRVVQPSNEPEESAEG